MKAPLPECPDGRGFCGSESALAVAFAVRLRAAHRVKQNVEVAEGRENKGKMNALPPTGFALNHRRVPGVVDGITNSSYNPRNYRAADNCHIQKSRTVAGERAQFGDSAGE